jgi:hypothetical protein
MKHAIVNSNTVTVLFIIVQNLNVITVLNICKANNLHVLFPQAPLLP